MARGNNYFGAASCSQRTARHNTLTARAFATTKTFCTTAISRRTRKHCDATEITAFAITPRCAETIGETWPPTSRQPAPGKAVRRVFKSRALVPPADCFDLGPLCRETAHELDRFRDANCKQLALDGLCAPRGSPTLSQRHLRRGLRGSPTVFAPNRCFIDLPL